MREVRGHHLSGVRIVPQVRCSRLLAELSDARTQARRLLIERGTPVETIEVACQDEPTLRRGDRVTISAGSLAGEYDVLGVMHDRLLSMQMELARHTDGEG